MRRLGHAFVDVFTQFPNIPNDLRRAYRAMRRPAQPTPCELCGGPSTAVACPACGEVIDVPIRVTIHDGQFIKCDPDLADVWAHSWTHDERPI